MKVKILTISSIATYEYQMVPIIRLSGKWLEKLGFKVGMKVEVAYSDGLIVIMLLDKNRTEKQQQRTDGEDGNNEL